MVLSFCCGRRNFLGVVKNKNPLRIHVINPRSMNVLLYPIESDNNPVISGETIYAKEKLDLAIPRRCIFPFPLLSNKSLYTDSLSGAANDIQNPVETIDNKTAHIDT